MLESIPGVTVPGGRGAFYLFPDFSPKARKLRARGIRTSVELCERLLAGGAPGLHIYTLNRANATFLLWQRLNR